MTFDMRIGGAEQVIYNLVRHTDCNRYDIHIICLHQQLGPFGQRLQQQGVEIVCFDRQSGFDLNLVKRIRRYLRQRHIDILQCHQYTPYVYGLLSAIGTRTRVIFTEHGRFYPDQRRLKRVLLNPLFALVTDRITAISQATRTALVEFENFPAERIQAIYNGLDDTHFRNGCYAITHEALGIPPTAQVLGTVARLDAIKNQPMMIRALQLIRKTFPDACLLIVGDGPERDNLQQLAAGLELTDAVIITGFKDDVYRYYKVMDVFLLTSFSEGTAMTLLEAMAAGLPCVVTNVGGNPEIVRDGETGFVVPTDEHTMLAGKIITLLQNPDLKQKLARAARDRFRNNFSVDRMVHAYQDLYDQVIRTDRP